MNEIIEKIGSFNLFTNLLPGVLLSVLVTNFTKFDLLQGDLVVGAFVYYFVGVVVSRVGSLLIEPIIEKLRLITFADYAAYLQAARVDPKIQTLLEVNNTYRSMISLFVCFGLFLLFEKISNIWPRSLEIVPELITAFFLVLFVLAWRKQTRYIKMRIQNTSEQEDLGN